MSQPRNTTKLVIQGHTLDPDTRANLVNFVAGEDTVEIDLDISHRSQRGRFSRLSW